MAFKFEKLIVWQKSLDLTALVHEVALKFPKDELYILTSQIKRAADSCEEILVMIEALRKSLKVRRHDL